jgi:hypothetical protein
MSSLPDSRASRGAQRARNKGLRMGDGSGRISCKSFAIFDPQSHSWKTFQASLFEAGFPLFSEDWPKAGSMQNGICLVQQTWARRISDSGCSYWPTATAQSYGRNKGGSNPNGPERPSLETLAKKWPTPQASDGHKATGGHGGKLDSLRAAMLAQRNGQPAYLNPLFVEALMGFPPGWTDCDAAVTQSFRKWLRLRGASFGNKQE